MANNIASWDGNSWNILGTDSTNNGINYYYYGDYGGIVLAMNGTNNLFVAGQFTSVDGSSILANNIASWDGNAWYILGSNSTNNGINGQVNALAMNGSNDLIIAGSFDIPCSSGIASFDGPLFLGVPQSIQTSDTTNTTKTATSSTSTLPILPPILGVAFGLLFLILICGCFAFFGLKLFRKWIRQKEQPERIRRQSDESEEIRRPKLKLKIKSPPTQQRAR